MSGPEERSRREDKQCRLQMHQSELARWGRDLTSGLVRAMVRGREEEGGGGGEGEIGNQMEGSSQLVGNERNGPLSYALLIRIDTAQRAPE